jgi:FXSXX-COOH protein
MTRERLNREQADAERHGTQCMWFPRGSDAANCHSAKLGSKRAAERQNNSIRRFAACFSANVGRPSLTKLDNSNDTVNRELGEVTHRSRARAAPPRTRIVAFSKTKKGVSVATILAGVAMVTWAQASRAA